MENVAGYNGIESHIDDYCAVLVRRGRKETTAKDVRNALRKCAAWLASAGIAEPEDVTAEAVAMLGSMALGRRGAVWRVLGDRAVRVAVLDAMA